MSKKITNLKVKIRDMTTFNKNNFLEDLKELEKLHLQKCYNADKMLNVYHNKLRKKANKHIPCKRLSKKKQNFDNKKYTKQKKVFYGKLMKTKTNFDITNPRNRGTKSILSYLKVKRII